MAGGPDYTELAPVRKSDQSSHVTSFEFVEDVDRSKVLTAQNIMTTPLTTNIDIDG